MRRGVAAWLHPRLPPCPTKRPSPEILAASVDGRVRRYDVRAGCVAADDLDAPVRQGKGGWVMALWGKGEWVYGFGRHEPHVPSTADPRPGPRPPPPSPPPQTPPSSACFTTDGQCVLAACLDSAVRLLDREGGALLATYTGERRGVGAGWAGRWARGCRGATWERRAATRDSPCSNQCPTNSPPPFLGHKHTGVKMDAATTADDATVVAGSEDGRVLFWDVVAEGVRAELVAAPGPVCSLALHPGGSTMMVTAAIDGVVRVWGPPGQ